MIIFSRGDTLNKYIEKLKEEKSVSYNIVIFSVILSTIINIVSDSVCVILNIKPIVYIIIGIIVSIVLIFTSLIYRIHKLNATTNYKGMFIINAKSNNKMIEIPNYNISEDMCKYLKSAFAENAAIKMIWESGNLQKLDPCLVNKEERILAKCDDSINLLLELIEYSILDNFSTFISGYFNSLHLNSNVIKFSKESIPKILFSNRFFKLFSEDISNRGAFVNTNKTMSSFINDGSIVYFINSNGAMYRKFDLCLPKGTKIYKENKNSLIIDTKLFVLKLEYLFGGFSTFIEKDFFKYYLNINSGLEYNSFEFNINTFVKYKKSSVFKINDWKYYNWLDKYIDRLEHYCNSKTFYNDISWNNNTLIRILNNIKKKEDNKSKATDINIT